LEKVDVVVVGSGLSGLTCALDLVDHGRSVLVLEEKPHLGGRTASWVEDGMPVESGFHRFRGIYRALPAMLKRAGLDPDSMVSWQTKVELRAAGARTGVFGIAPRWDPGRVLQGLAGYNRVLTPLDKASLLPLLLVGSILHAAAPHRLDKLSVAQLCRMLGVTRRARERVVTPLTRGVFFRPPEDYSAYAFMMPLAYSLRRPLEMRSGVYRGGMSEVMIAPLAQSISARGGTVRAASPVRSLHFEDGRVAGVRLDQGVIVADQVVVATAPPAAKALLQPLRDDPTIAGLFAMPTTPAVMMQLDLDRPALEADHPAFAPGTPLMVMAEQSRTTFPSRPGRLSILLSPQERLARMEPDAVLREVVEAARQVGLDLSGRILGYHFQVLEGDMYGAAPGVDRLRPGQATNVAGLTLAGDYTRQPFLSTMEGAVIAGERAAKAVLSRAA
jgi:15-cis-phytoene desaturase